eukprot:364308-Chlamydomonas_euryale.AAC.10
MRVRIPGRDWCGCSYTSGRDVEHFRHMHYTHWRPHWWQENGGTAAMHACDEQLLMNTAALLLHAHTGHVVLGIHLLHEVSKSQQHSDGSGSNGAASAWSVYLKELPRTYNTFCNWSESDIEALQVQHARDAVEAAVEDAKRQWNSALPALKALGMQTQPNTHMALKLHTTAIPCEL